MAHSPAGHRESGSMTVDAPAGAHAGAAPRDSDVSGDDTYETARTFESLGVSPELNKALADEGIVSAFPIQALTVADALAGRDVCGKAKTGSGKTPAFGGPLRQRTQATPGAPPYGGAAIPRQVTNLPKGVDVVIATPGRLIDLGDRGEIAVDQLETL